MIEKLKDYQVLDVLCGGTFYKVRHKVTNNIYAWKAFNCSGYTDQQIKNVCDEVKTISSIVADNLLHYYDTILHAPSKTLYFVLEYNSWQSLEELIISCTEHGKYIAESFIWYLVHELACLCKAVEDIHLKVLHKFINPSSIFVDESGELRVNCFDLTPPNCSQDVMRQLGDVIHTLCYRTRANDKIKEFFYSDDLLDVVSFLTDEKNANLRPDVVIYHPTVLANLETLAGPKNLSDILIPIDAATDNNKCDSEKVVGLCKSLEPVARAHSQVDSPLYSNISPKKAITSFENDVEPARVSLSPTIAALALELPGFVPRSRHPLNTALKALNSPQKISEKTLSQQWMSRLVTLRQREESLNKRERDLIAKEIMNSPAMKLVPMIESQDSFDDEINGITLPPMIANSKRDKRSSYGSQRHKRSSSVRTRSRRKTLYEDLDSSLSVDPGDGSVIVTAAKFTKENMPRRNIFPEVSTKKVHFTPSNPFVESDESVTLTFYELENVDGDGYQVPRNEEVGLSDINKFKYLDLEKVTTEKRSAMQQWNHSSPSKQAKITQKILADITNTNSNVKRTPSKNSIMSKTSNTSNGTQYSTASSKSQWSMKSADSKVSEGTIGSRTRASMRQSLAFFTPAPDKKNKSRKSLLPFKTPFKFMSNKA